MCLGPWGHRQDKSGSLKGNGPGRKGAVKEPRYPGFPPAPEVGVIVCLPCVAQKAWGCPREH